MALELEPGGRVSKRELASEMKRHCDLTIRNRTPPPKRRWRTAVDCGRLDGEVESCWSAALPRKPTTDGRLDEGGEEGYISNDLALCGQPG